MGDDIILPRSQLDLSFTRVRSQSIVVVTAIVSKCQRPRYLRPGHFLFEWLYDERRSSRTFRPNH